MSNLPIIVDFKHLDKDDTPLVGGKGANLGEMTKAGFPVPDGFAITIHAYDAFLTENNLAKKIYDTLAVADVNDPVQLNDASKRIQKMITNGKIPDEIVKDIVSAYKKLSGRFKKALVAVRSSATAEDAGATSFAGQQESYLDVQGEANLLMKVKECWASLFTARSIYYRVENKIKHESVKISVIVMKMVQSEVSGVMFSINPVKNDKDTIVIESVWGLGEMIVQGEVVPDTYYVQKDTFAILSKEISDQKIQLIRRNGKPKEVEVPKKNQARQKITDEEIVELAKLSDRLQKHYYFPQDTEWAKEGKKLYIVQTRPVTTIAETRKIEKIEGGKVAIAQTPILTGSGASPGIGTGPVKVLRSPKELSKIQKGDVLVAPMTSPDYVPGMKKSAAIVTDLGGQTSHAAIVSRELGVPCVVGTEEATKKLQDGQIITVNGETGEIFMGSNIRVSESHISASSKKPVKKLATATKILVNLAEPELASKVAKMNVDGVGLLRAEFMMANIGIHPREAIKRKEQDKFIDKLAHDLTTFCKAFYPRPVTYRATDFKTNEYRSLEGGKTWEPVESNPMLGFRGAFRYIATPEVFNLELQAIKKVREKYNNLHLMIPFVRSPEELAKVRRIVASEDLFEDPSFKFLMMCEIPVNVIQIDDFIKVGIDGVSIGSNDLTMLIEGTDRDNAEVAREFDERSPAVLWALRRVIRKCAEAGITSSICGQAPSEYEDLVEKLVRYGITDISVNPDAIDRTREVVYKVENKL
jgi:pyruvate,water dikinase